MKSNPVVIIEITAFQGRRFDAEKKSPSTMIHHPGQSPEITGDDIPVLLHEPPGGPGYPLGESCT